MEDHKRLDDDTVGAVDATNHLIDSPKLGYWLFDKHPSRRVVMVIISLVDGE
jgi:hypothetical protein